MDETREESIAELRAALGELESGEGLLRFVGGHGLMSRTFEFTWSEPALEIDFRLPYARVLADEESQKEDNAEVGAAIRMALLLLTVEGLKAEDLKEVRTSVWAGEAGVGYSMVDGEGNVVESGDDWSGLVRRLESVLPEGEESLSIIWP
jgi:hypothetical protein